VEREPAVVRARLERIEEAMRALQPPGRRGHIAGEVQRIGGEPRRHSAGRCRFTALAVPAQRLAARGHHRLLVVEPPRRPTHALERLGRQLSRERALKERARVGPATVAQRDPSRGTSVGGRICRRGHDRSRRTYHLFGAAARPS